MFRPQILFPRLLLASHHVGLRIQTCLAEEVEVVELKELALTIPNGIAIARITLVLSTLRDFATDGSASLVFEVAATLEVGEGLLIDEWRAEVEIVVIASAVSRSLKNRESEIWCVFEVADNVTTSADGCVDGDICPASMNVCGLKEMEYC
ncbi:hypothetical protein WAI453_000191 [Rhynchosporium graminicola]